MAGEESMSLKLINVGYSIWNPRREVEGRDQQSLNYIKKLDIHELVIEGKYQKKIEIIVKYFQNKVKILTHSFK
jgi:hypothetical protein